MSKGRKLTGKQRIFIDQYLQCYNATEAARRAGYQGSDIVLGSVGCENLKKPKIAKAISEYFAASAMGRDETLARLGEQARTDLGDYIDAAGYVDVDKLKGDGKTHLIKKYEMTRLAGGNIRVKIEVHDPQRALELIGKHHGLFVERRKIEGEIKHDISKDLRDNLLGKMARIAETGSAPEVHGEPEP